MPGFDLSKWQQDYQDAPWEPENSGNRADVPDGKYQVKVARVALEESKIKHSPLLAWELDILAGPHANRKLWRNNVLVSADNIRFLKQDLYCCGLQLKNINDLNDQNVLGELIGVTLEVTQKTKGDNKNVYFNKRISVGAPGRTASRPAPQGAFIADDSLVPF